MTIKQLGGVFGRNPTFNDVTIEGTLTFDGDIDITSDLTVDGTVTANGLTVDTDTLVVDATNNRVGIGTSSPSSVLHLSTSNDPKITLTDTGFGASADITGSNGNLRLNSQTATIFDMADSEVMRIDASGHVGIGTTSPANDAKLHSAGSIISTDATLGSYNFDNAGFDFIPGTKVARFFATSTDTTGGVMTFITGQNASYGERMRIDSSGNVGIGTSTNLANGTLNVESNGTSVLQARSDTAGVNDGDTTVVVSRALNSTAGKWANAIYRGYTHAWSYGSSAGSNEAMRIDSSGNLLVGKDVANSSVAGVQLLPEGDVGVTRDGSHALLLNRLTSDGDIALFRKDGTTVGSISAHGGAINIGNGITSLKFLPALNTIHPNGNGSGSDGLTTLGWSNNRFKDLYLSGGAYLGGTAAANHLDDYEEGTFNITLTDSNSGSDTLQMKYVKIGRVVTIEGPFRGSEGSTASTFFLLSGTADSNLTLSCSLPFTPKDSGCCISPIHRNMERRSDGLNPDQGYALPVLAWAAGNATCYLTDTQTEKAYDGATGTGGGNTWRKADTRTNVVLQFNAVYMTT